MKQLLLPFPYKIAGIALSVIGGVFTFMRFYLGIKPGYLNLEVFAIYSSFFKTKWFSPITNNLSEELCIFFVLSGIFLIAFSYEKREQVIYNELRYQSIMIAFFLNFLFLIFSTIFIYGIGFIFFLIVNIFSPFIFYIIIFRIRLFRYFKHSGN